MPPDDGQSIEFYYHKALVDLIFFMVITVVGLDIIFGMVVDTFAELRDSKVRVDVKGEGRLMNDVTNVVRSCLVGSRSANESFLLHLWR